MFFIGFQCFVKVWENCAGTCFPTGSGGPKVRHGPQLGARNSLKVPILEAQSAPKTSTWRSKAFQRPQLGGPEPFREPKLEAPSDPRTQLGSPQRRKELKLELQSASESPIWRAKTFRDPNLEAQRASKMQTKAFAEPNLPMIRATRSRSIRPNHMETQKGKEKPLTPRNAG